MANEILDELVADILTNETHFLDGLHRRSSSFAALVAAVIDWSRKLGRPVDSLAAGIEPSFRQSILFSLIPIKALDPASGESYEALVDEHLGNLGISVPHDQKRNLIDLLININKLKGMTSGQARAQTARLGNLKLDLALYEKVLNRQGYRCVWCGVKLDNPAVVESLEHMLPKHLGDDLPEALNWAIACSSCNSGKQDSVVWSTTAYAFDFFERNDFQDLEKVSLKHRWTVLCRDGKCDDCGIRARDSELFVYKRINTGLAIPTNCSTTCLPCSVNMGINPLAVDWLANEVGRG